MFYDIKFTEEIFNIPSEPPPLRRQHAFKNLLDVNNIHNSNLDLVMNDNIFRSIPDFNYPINIDNSVVLKRHNSDTNILIKRSELKRIKTI